jgi:hypothetical protein
MAREAFGVSIYELLHDARREYQHTCNALVDGKENLSRPVRQNPGHDLFQEQSRIEPPMVGAANVAGREIYWCGFPLD